MNTEPHIVNSYKMNTNNVKSYRMNKIPNNLKPFNMISRIKYQTI